MALKMNYVHFGINVAAAYIRVMMPTVSADKASVMFCVSYHADANQPSFHNEQVQGPYDLDGPNPLCQAYSHLKTLEEFADAVDVLEEGQSL